METTVNPLLAKAEKAVELEHVDLAAKLCEDALAQDPEEWEAYRVFAWVEFHRKQYAKALELIREFLRVNPDHAWSVAFEGRVFVMLDQVEEAHAAFRRALELDPNLSVAHLWYGYYCQSVEEDWDRAEVHLRKALELEPENEYYMTTLAEFEEAQGNFTEAETLFRRALEIAPTEARVFRVYAEYLHRNHRYDEARPLLREALRLEPDNESIRGLYFSNYSLQESDQALAMIEEELKTCSPEWKSVWYYLRGFIYKEVKRKTREAEDSFELALQHGPDNHSAHFQYGLILVASIFRFRVRKGLEHLRRAVELDPKNMAYLTVTAVSLGKAGYHEEAEAMFEKAFSLPGKKDILWQNYGYYLLDVKKDGEKGVEYYQKAYEHNPENLQAQKNLKHVLQHKHPLYATLFHISGKLKTDKKWKVPWALLWLIIGAALFYIYMSFLPLLYSLPILWLTRNPHWLLVPFIQRLSQSVMHKEGLSLKG